MSVERPEARTCSVDHAAALLGVGRATLYKQIREHGYVVPGVPAIKIMSRLVVPLQPLERYLAETAAVAS